MKIPSTLEDILIPLVIALGVTAVYLVGFWDGKNSRELPPDHDPHAWKFIERSLDE